MRLATAERQEVPAAKSSPIPDDRELQQQVRAFVVCCDDEGNTPGFGKGAAALLQGIERYGSITHAARDLHMAYSRAWTMLNKIEEGFGFKLLERKLATGSALTPEGERFLRLYERFEADVESYTRKRFDEVFGGF